MDTATRQPNTSNAALFRSFQVALHLIHFLPFSNTVQVQYVIWYR